MLYMVVIYIHGHQIYENECLSAEFELLNKLTDFCIVVIYLTKINACRYFAHC